VAASLTLLIAAEVLALSVWFSAAAGVATAASFGGPPALVALLLVLWGLTIIPDSARFSALVADAAPPACAGSLLAAQTALGFALSAVTVQALPGVARLAGRARAARARPAARRGGAASLNQPGMPLRARRSRASSICRSAGVRAAEAASFTSFEIGSSFACSARPASVRNTSLLRRSAALRTRRT